MIVNADYSQQLNGWTLEEGEPSVQTEKDYKTFLAQLLTNVNMSQTLHDLRPGLYEVHFSGYAELKNAAEETAYNFTSFVYANGNRNNFHTKFTGLLTEEEGQKELETAPNAFGPVSDAQGNLLGYGGIATAGEAMPEIVEDSNGTLTIAGYGEQRIGQSFVVTFNVRAVGDAQVTLTEAYVDRGVNALKDARAADITTSTVTIHAGVSDGEEVSGA